jgi:hypothetical protein
MEFVFVSCYEKYTLLTVVRELTTGTQAWSQHARFLKTTKEYLGYDYYEPISYQGSHRRQQCPQTHLREVMVKERRKGLS